MKTTKTVLFLLLFAGVFLFFYIGYKFGNPTPCHLTDQPNIPAPAKEMAATFWLPSSVSSVYYFSDRKLRSSRYMRCRITNKSDFDVYLRENVKGQNIYSKAENLENVRIPETIKSWFALEKVQPHEILVRGKFAYLIIDYDKQELYMMRFSD